MQTTKMYKEILQEVISISEMSYEELMKGNESHKVEVRVALVDALYRLGMRDNQIAYLTGINRKTVNRYHNSCYHRSKQSFNLRMLIKELSGVISDVSQKYLTSDL